MDGSIDPYRTPAPATMTASVLQQAQGIPGIPINQQAIQALPLSQHSQGIPSLAMGQQSQGIATLPITQQQSDYLAQPLGQLPHLSLTHTLLLFSMNSSTLLLKSGTMLHVV